MGQTRTFPRDISPPARSKHLSPSARIAQLRNVRSHLSSARKRGMTTIVKNITRIDAAWDAMVAEYAKLGASASPEEFKPLAKALADLYRAVNKAYEEAPVEYDAYRTGDAVFEAFHAALKAQRKKRAAAAA